MLICNAERKHKQLLAVIGIGAGAILTACQRPAEATPIPATLTEPCPPAVLSEDEYVFSNPWVRRSVDDDPIVMSKDPEKKFDEKTNSITITIEGVVSGEATMIGVKPSGGEMSVYEVSNSNDLALRLWPNVDGGLQFWACPGDTDGSYMRFVPTKPIPKESSF